MTHADALDILAVLQDAYPRQELRDGTITLYVDNLTDLDHEAGKQACLSLIRTRTFFPSVAEIREAVAVATLAIPAAEMAWHEVCGAVKAYDEHDDACRWPKFTHPLIAQVLGDLGGVRCLYYSTNPSTDRAHFLRLYRDLRESELQTASIGQLPSGQVCIGAGKESA
jgi:hypothetical protein